MSGLREKLESWLRSAAFVSDPFEAAVRKAQRILNRMVASGTTVSNEISGPILQAATAVSAGCVTPEIEQAFYAAYSRLAKLAPRNSSSDDEEPENPFQDALADAELLLKFSSETGVEVSNDIVEPILVATTAYRSGTVSEPIRVSFYSAYSKLAKLFGEVTADSIRNCTAPETRRTLVRNRYAALVLTLFIATFSVLTFVANTMSSAIQQDITSANASAAALRASLTPGGGNNTIEASYAQSDPCQLIDQAPTGSVRTVQNVGDVEQLQGFASAIRDLRTRAIKLNWFVFRWECDPFGSCANNGHPPDGATQNRQLQLNPAILNYPAETLCKIKTYQLFRDFASNVLADYAAFVGALAAHALPIFYALLGAYAYRLRLFGETIRKRTYHPSFADSARMITAVIAGAIAGLINPAQGLALSPLATAFLVGYGVELFFKFLDTLINAFGSAPKPRRA